MSQLEELKAAIRGHLDSLDCVIGWEQGYDPLHATPLFIRTEADLDRLNISPLAVHNLATYATGFKGKKIGITQKGSTFHYMMGRVLETKGLSLNDVAGHGDDAESRHHP